MFIVDADLDEEKNAALLQRVHRYLKEGEGTVIRTEDWGVRRLAYPIQHKREGHYYLMYFAMPPANVKQFERSILLAEGIMREIIVRVEKIPAGPEPEPVAEESAPTAKEEAPAVEESAPAPEEATSAPEETAPASENE
jgi:small subunit ribosomal protein S6